ncbi:MAG: hypothetical protein WCF84_13320 [Anaerolineae bacterium]
MSTTEDQTPGRSRGRARPARPEICIDPADGEQARASRRAPRLPRRFNLLALLLIVIGLSLLTTAPLVSAQGRRVGIPWKGRPGIRETVAQIMAREKQSPKPQTPSVNRRLRAPAFTHNNPQSPRVPAWPAAPGAPRTPGRRNPQPVVDSWLAAIITDSFNYPPDTMGAVGPDQVFVVINGRARVFDKQGNVGGLNVSTTTLFASVITPGASTTDPRVRYDRLSGRWFISIIDFPDVPNRIMLAVSSGSHIDDTTSFTFYQFQFDAVGTTPNADTGLFCDYPTLGVDKLALYIGCNVYDLGTGFFINTTAFVVNKADLIAGTLTVTPFRTLLTAGPFDGPYSPEGVMNDDPNATEGYFIGPTILTNGQLTLLRVSTPGGTPALSGNLDLTVPATSDPIPQPALGSTTLLDGGDQRVFNPTIHINKITGALTLWTSHTIEVDATCVGTAGGGRNGSRWYEIGSLTGTPALVQSGTLCDPAGTSPRGFIYSDVAESGQGHMALGVTFASNNDYASIAVAGRFRTDTAGALQSYTVAQAGVDLYTVVPGDNRWGDYSQTVVDPTDDQTFWTFQEYASAADIWAVRVIKLQAPPPAAITSVAPNAVATGVASTVLTVAGTSASGSEFFDPGADTGGPGYANRLAVTFTDLGASVTINSVALTDPTHLAVDVSTVGATTGIYDLTVTNPDGQSVTFPAALYVGVAQKVWSGGGLTNNWSDGANWTPAGAPGLTDQALFDGTSNKNATVDINPTIDSVSITSGYGGIISLGANTLTTSGGFAQSGGAFNAGTGALNIGGNFTANGGFVAGTSTLTLNGASGVQTVTAGSPFNNVTVANTAGIALGGSVSVGGALNASGGPVSVGSNTLTLDGSVTCGVISSAASGGVVYNQAANGQNVCAGNYGGLTFSNWNKVLASSGVIGVAAAFAPGAATGHTVTGSTVNFNGTAAQSVPAFSYHNLTLSNTAATVGASANFDVAGTLNLNGTNVVFAPDAGVVVNSGGAQGTLTGSGTLRVTRTSLSDDLRTQYLFVTYTLTGLRVDYAGAGDQQVSTVGYSRLAVSGSGTKSLQNDTTVSGDLSIAAGATLDASTSNYALTVGGNWSNRGVFTARSGVVTLNGASAATAANFSTLLSQGFNGVTPPAVPAGWSVIDANGDGYTWGTSPGTYAPNAGATANDARYGHNPDNATAANDWLFTPGLALTAGTPYYLQFKYGNRAFFFYRESMEVRFNTTPAAGGTLIVNLPNITSPTWSNSGPTAFTVPAAGTYYIGFHANSAAGAYDLAVDDIAVYQPTTFSNLVVDDPGGVTLSGTRLIASNTLTLSRGVLTNGALLALDSGATITRTAGALSAAPLFGSIVDVVYNGSTAVTSGPELPTATTVLNNLTDDNTGGVQLASSATVNGTLTLNAGAALTSSGATLTLKGDWVDNGATFSPGTDTVVFAKSGTANLTLSATNGVEPFYNLTVMTGTTVLTGDDAASASHTLANYGVMTRNAPAQTVTTGGGAVLFTDPGNRTTVRLTSTGATDLGSTTVTTTMHAAPPTCGGSSVPTGVLRYMDITPTNTTGVAATLRLYFLSSADAGLDEANGNATNSVAIYHCNGLTWQVLPGPYGAAYDPAVGLNYIEVGNVTAFSPFAIGSGTPTAVTLGAFSAAWQGTSVLVQWNTLSEINNLGFNLLRSTSAAGPYTPLNDKLIPGCAGCSTGQSYRYTDVNVTPNTTYYYKLQAVDKSGATQLFGPVKAAPACSATPGQSALDGPANGAVVTTLHPTLRWNTATCAARYEVQVRQGTASGPLVAQPKNLTSAQFAPAGLTAGKSYYWRVRACNAAGCGAWSGWWRFSVATGAVGLNLNLEIRYPIPL